MREHDHYGPAELASDLVKAELERDRLRQQVDYLLDHIGAANIEEVIMENEAMGHALKALSHE
jgi:hypothetical protein